MGNNGSAERTHRECERAAREQLERVRRAVEEVQSERERVQRAAEERERKVREEQEQEQRVEEERERKIREEQEQALRTAEEMERKILEERERVHMATEEMKREAQEELEQTQRKVREELELARKAAEGIERGAQEKLEQAQKAAKENEEEARKKLERGQEDLRKGIERETLPLKEEVEAAKAKINYQKENLHFAVCGAAGSGKSSLINAIRGTHSGMPGAAKTGTTETTTDIGRYPDHHTDDRSRFVWYDVPGAGTISVPGWQHFNDQGLYAFDFILVVTDARITKVDLQIIKNSRRFGIPTFIIRSKADQHIRNLQDDMSPQETFQSPSCGGGDEGVTCNNPYELARDKYISETRKSVTENLLQADLPDQPVYIICRQAMYGLMNGRDATRKIDEEKLLHDLRATALDEQYSHRTGPSI